MSTDFERKKPMGNEGHMFPEGLEGLDDGGMLGIADAEQKASAELPVAPVTREAVKADFRPRWKAVLIRILLLLYLAWVPVAGYWYWIRPVRVDQFRDAHEKWRAIAQIFHVPVPRDERWGW